jgi:urease accessory protein
MGKQFLNTLGHVYDFDLLTWWQEQVKQRQAHGHYAVIYGMSEALLETPLRMAVTAFMYSSACALVHNAVRAIPLGQQTGVKIIHELLPHIDAAGRAAAKLTLSDLANNALGIEMGSMEHEFLHSRLFLS